MQSTMMHEEGHNQGSLEDFYRGMMTMNFQEGLHSVYTTFVIKPSTTTGIPHQVVYDNGPQWDQTHPESTIPPGHQWGHKMVGADSETGYAGQPSRRGTVGACHCLPLRMITSHRLAFIVTTKF